MSYMKITPHRGGATKMTTGSGANTVLAAGELFIEYPDDGVGSGKSKIKIGDGVTAYSSLPYAVGETSTDKIDFTQGAQTTIQSALADVASGNTLQTIVGSLKQAVALCKEKIALYDSTVLKNGIAHNGVYRGKDLGTISDLATWEAFRVEHGIGNDNGNTYKDLYLGDTIVIPTGEYYGNLAFQVAGFNTLYRTGDATQNKTGIIFVQKHTGKTAKVYTNRTDMNGGFVNSNVYTNILPAFVDSISDIFDTHLQNMRLLLTNNYNGTKAGIGVWRDTQACIMSSLNIGMICPDSSLDDFGVDPKFPLYNFETHFSFASGFYLRDLLPDYQILSISNGGRLYRMAAESGGYGVRPFIYLN